MQDSKYSRELITTVPIKKDPDVIEDMVTARWFTEFIARVPNDRTPIALGIFYDHWKVSQTSKIGGLYFTILNSLPSTYFAPDNKLVLALVPELIDVQLVLGFTLGCLLESGGQFNITIVDATFRLYMEISEIVGDVPGLAEFCACKNHAGNSPCRKCKATKEQLFSFRHREPKTQAALKPVLQEMLMQIEARKEITKAKEKLQDLGLLTKTPFLFSFQHMDQCRQSLACLMHNEELGLFKRELKFYMSHIGDDNTTVLFH